MFVSTAVVSTRSLRPRVTFSDRASWTTRSLSASRVSGPDGVGPADQRGVVGDLLEVDPAELAEHQAVVDEVLGLLVAPAVEPHDHEHPEDDLHRGGGPAAGARSWGERRARSSRTALDDLVVVEQAVELLELGLEAEAELGDQGEQIGPVVAVAEHACSLPEAAKPAYFAPQTRTTHAPRSSGMAAARPHAVVAKADGALPSVPPQVCDQRERISPESSPAPEERSAVPDVFGLRLASRAVAG